MVTINELAEIFCNIAAVHLQRKDIDGPQGVRGHHSDNTRLRQALEWEPAISLEDGPGQTYDWIERRLRQRSRSGLAEQVDQILCHLSGIRSLVSSDAM